MRRFLLLAALIVPIWIIRPALAVDDPVTLDLLLNLLTKEKAIERALVQHPTISKAKAHLDQARARLDETKRWFKPKVSLYAGERFDNDRSRFGIQISQEIDSLWDQTPTREAEADLLIAEQELILTRQAVVKEVSSAYEACLLARMKSAQVALRQERSLQELNHARHQYDEGLISRAKLTELEKAIEEADRELLNSSGDIAQATLRLRQAMGEIGAPG